MKGIILAGGTGSRLAPITTTISKQLLPIHDKPMIFYPLSTILLAGIRDILIIVDPAQKNHFEKLLGDGSDLGANISYTTQEKPEGIGQSFILAEDFLGNDSCLFILGDNIFYGTNFTNMLKARISDHLKLAGVTLFCHNVNNPKEFGVAEIKGKRVISLEEKPAHPKSNLAVTGMYIYDNNVVKYAKKIKKSARGELEITDINKIYLKKNKISYHDLGRGYAWLDTGTSEALNKAANFIQIIEERQGLKIGCLEEIALRNKWISKDKLSKYLKKKPNSSYYGYLKKLLKNDQI